MGKVRTFDDLKKINCPNHIKTKAVRQSVKSKDRHAKKKLKKKERLKRRKAGEAPGIPRTLENTRERDETVLDTTETERVEEVEQDVATDEFQNYFEKSYEPKVLITFSDNPLKKSRVFGVELSRIIPNSLVRYRNRASVKKMIESAKRRNFSDIIIVNENMRQPNGLLLIHLPDGPTAHFRLSNVKITTELKKNHKNITTHRPEVIVNNFSTRLGMTIGRMLSSVFHYDPEFKGRRVVTFHNQRDYIFFRHHRYEFKENAKPRLKELGPRFTLRLQSLQKGTFDSKCGEYEWIQTSRRHEIETSRRRFFL